MCTTRVRLVALAAAVVMALALSPEALALPRLGERLPDALLSDPGGKALDTRTLRGKPALVLYEDEESLDQNAPLKDALADLARDARYRVGIGFAAVADVSEYAGWPFRGMAEEAIRERARGAGIPIYCDWNGAFRRAYQLHQGLSNVVLLGPDGRVLFAAAGPLRPEQRSRLLALLARQIPAF